MKGSLIALVAALTACSALVLGNLALPTPAAARAAPIGNGTYRVGRDIAPGTYRVRRPAHACYWARLSGFSGKVTDVKANDFGSGFMVVTIRRHDKGFQTSHCGRWSSNLSRVTSSMTSFGKGTFIVGTDIRPGWYRSSNVTGCYWARLRGFDGSLREIIANGVRTHGHAVVRIRRRDVGFQSRGCGTWTRL
jgi:hypothetical protein